MTATKKPKFDMDMAIDAIEKKLDNPECDAQIIKLERIHSKIESLEFQLKKAQQDFKDAAGPLSSMLDILGTCSYEYPARNFKIMERHYKEIHIIDKPAFMKWLKENCPPSEILELLTPPTTLAQLKKFISNKLQNTKEHDFEIPGILTKNNYTILRGYRNGKEKSEDYKKESKEKSGFKKGRSSDYKKGYVAKGKSK